MKRSIKLFAAIVLMAGFSTTLMAQTSATVTGTAAGVKLIVPMTITQIAPLHFGTINLMANAGGSVILTTGNTRTPTTVVLSTVAPVSSNASFDVTGTINSSYAVQLPATITVTRTLGGTETMSIGSLKVLCTSNGATDGLIGTLSATGTDHFVIGGTLTISNPQVPGIYAGLFNVTVDYN
jgi:hypothetical protein